MDPAKELTRQAKVDHGPSQSSASEESAAEAGASSGMREEEDQL